MIKTLLTWTARVTATHMISACGRDHLNILLFARAFKAVGRICVGRNMRTAVGYCGRMFHSMLIPQVMSDASQCLSVI